MSSAEEKSHGDERQEEANSPKEEFVNKGKNEDNDCNNAAEAEKSKGYTLHIGNLKFETTEDGLRQEFSKFGNVKSVRIITHKNGNSKGYGFIEMETKESAEEAIEKLNKADFDGRTITVQYAKSTDEPRPRRPRSTYRRDDRRDFRDVRRDLRDDRRDRDRDRRRDRRDRDYDDRRDYRDDRRDRRDRDYNRYERRRRFDRDRYDSDREFSRRRKYDYDSPSPPPKRNRKYDYSQSDD
ncbi:splicing factor, arginine/serine-rich [Tritrichomonas foetus]|uniref:Splicing factor, arginine/serine-rich n=1 Tax=Tritrichomonas foetus TaxID=1144522 RepID=A0A1J4JIX4_9EUKA|nr:splicing factor, arginine/serine-rich [Tritrichomonas foetus]|eukprot:OHS97172.1 splicing factor, arginine/serine-rich [Tritrichomonas foetus]